jgi:BirA family biotin operon repressor/biotin-[acetyl-CoA-carboxylase] ligase
MKLAIEHFESLPSTQDSAKAFVLDGAGEGTIVVANSQTAGYGRLDRTWQSPEGNIYASIVLAPNDHTGAPQMASYGQLALAAGLAILKGINAVAPIPVQLKWPRWT